MIKQHIEEKIKSALVKSAIPDQEILVQSPANTQFGDYTSNIAMQLAKELKKNPYEIAQEIVKNISPDEVIEKAEVMKPGFINVWIKQDLILKEIQKIIEKKEKYGFLDTYKGQKVVFEYTDPNPFKEFHIGHLYSNTIGESLSRIYEANGAIVWRADYFGDVGMHVAKSLWGVKEKLKEDNISMKQLGERPLKERIKYLGASYARGATAYEENPQAVDQMKTLNFLIFKAAQEVVLPEFNESPQINYDQFIKDTSTYSYEDIKELYRLGRTWSLMYFEEIYARLGTKFDGYYPESRTGEFGYGMVMEALKKGIFERGEGGAVIFPGKKYGLHNRVFINSLGLPTYETKDFGNAVAKRKDFQYDSSIIVTGNEIDEYFKVVLEALKKLHPDLGNNTIHIGHGMVRLPEGKMSSRTGKIITGEWLLDETKKQVQELIKKSDKISSADIDKVSEKVAIGAIKYTFLKTSIGKDIIFNFNESLSIEGNSGPYLQYTYARCKSVLEKEASATDPLSIKELNEEEISLLRTLNKFSESIEEAGKNYAPNLLCNYLFNLAQKYNLFYQKHQILKADGETKQFRLALTQATAQVVKNGLNLLGIETVEKM